VALASSGSSPDITPHRFGHRMRHAGWHTASAVVGAGEPCELAQKKAAPPQGPLGEVKMTCH
jgi:hypothetical protein